MTPSSNTFSVMVVGIGGQGVMLLSKVLAIAATKVGAVVAKTESRGLSQRGGAVAAEVRIGGKCAPVLGTGNEDLILSLDALEALRALPLLGPHGVLLTNSDLSPPLHLVRTWQAENGAFAQESFYHAVSERLGTLHCVHSLDLNNLAKRNDLKPALNAILLGAAAPLLPLPSADLLDALLESVPEHFRDLNRTAYRAGQVAMLPNTKQPFEIQPTLATPA